MDKIEIKGARIHNLKNIDISIPKNKMVLITGVSGSGKLSLTNSLYKISLLLKFKYRRS